MASILTRAPLTAADADEVRRTLAALARPIERDVFSFEDRPFMVSFREDYPGELADIVGRGLPAVLGWTPRDDGPIITAMPRSCGRSCAIRRFA